MTVRLIQVGLGGWGRDWARLLARHTELVQVVGYVDVQPDMLALLQHELGITQALCFPSLDAALAATSADAVLVTAALPGHVPVALAALAAGKHVLVEKPFAPSLAEAQHVANLAAQQKRVLMVSQNYRFYPAVQAVAALLRTGKLGAVGAVNIQFRKYANTHPAGMHRHYLLPQPLLMDMAIHHFDLMRFVLNQEPVSVSCRAWNPRWSKFTDPATATATIAFDGGAVVTYNGSWVSTGTPTTWAGDWQIECENGLISWTSRNDTSLDAEAVTLRLRGKRARRLALPNLPYWDRAGSLAAFVTAIHSGTEPPASGRDNSGSLALMFAAITAAQTELPQLVQAAPSAA